ncbi:hypothetical protein Jiend_62530 [Micromonospora endophytica]|nr:hypothetical protein Jiend_62530 [Micromonospora endophytica]
MVHHAGPGRVALQGPRRVVVCRLANPEPRAARRGAGPTVVRGTRTPTPGATLVSHPHEQDRLLVHVAADVARRRRERGLRLNYPEAVALITAFLLEGARDGRSVVDLMAAGRTVLTRDDVQDGIPELLREVQVEATFPDGTKLVTVHHPIP